MNRKYYRSLLSFSDMIIYIYNHFDWFWLGIYLKKRGVAKNFLHNRYWKKYMGRISYDNTFEAKFHCVWNCVFIMFIVYNMICIGLNEIIIYIRLIRSWLVKDLPCLVAVVVASMAVGVLFFVVAKVVVVGLVFVAIVVVVTSLVVLFVGHAMVVVVIFFS